MFGIGKMKPVATGTCAVNLDETACMPYSSIITHTLLLIILRIEAVALR
jgi:hypothetical protein